MLDRKVRVREVKDLGAGNHLLTINSREQARLVQPGQFMMLKCAPGLNDNPILRRPFSVFDVDPDPVLDRVLAGTHQRAQPGLHQQRKAHRVRWLHEDDEERISRGADLLRLFELTQDFADQISQQGVRMVATECMDAGQTIGYAKIIVMWASLLLRNLATYAATKFPLEEEILASGNPFSPA
jgi:hypothetical protein